jgi:hypothetical protein
MAVPKVKSGKGSAIPELAAQEILFGPGDRIFLMQDTAGITGTSVRAGFKFQLHLDGASRTIPAQVVFTFDYPVAGSGGVSAVAIDGVFPAEYSTAHRFAFTRTEGKRELVLSKLPDHVPAHGPAAARHDDSWHRGYRQQAPKAEDPAAVALRQFQQGAEEKKGPAVPAEKADDAD